MGAGFTRMRRVGSRRGSCGYCRRWMLSGKAILNGRDVGSGAAGCGAGSSNDSRGGNRGTATLLSDLVNLKTGQDGASIECTRGINGGCEGLALCDARMVGTGT